MPDIPWRSLSAFLAMDGKALYVWGSFVVALACMLIEALAVSARKRRAAQAAVASPGATARIEAH